MSFISVLILSLNEEINLAACLDSCAWCDDIVVFDSFSDDGTGAIAAAKGARFVQRRFDNYAAQRNAALTEVRYKHPWVFMVDADERIPPDLAEELRQAVAQADEDTVLFRMRLKDFFMGRWLRRSSVLERDRGAGCAGVNENGRASRAELRSDMKAMP